MHMTINVRSYDKFDTLYNVYVQYEQLSYVEDLCYENGTLINTKISPLNFEENFKI